MPDFEQTKRLLITQKEARERKSRRHVRTGHMTADGPMSPSAYASLSREERRRLNERARDKTKPAWVNR